MRISDWSSDVCSSDLAGMSRAGLTSAFRRHMGRSVGDYLSDYRVLVAKRELSLGRPVALVSDELGYASPAAFARMFKARAGQTPREWATRACSTVPRNRSPVPPARPCPPPPPPRT